MQPNEFLSLLNQLSSRVLNIFSQDAQEHLEDAERTALRRGTLWFEPASELEISDAEHRLGTTLPDDYKTFLRLTNGSVLPAIESHTARLLPIGSVRTFREVDLSAFASWQCSDLVDGNKSIEALQCMPAEVDLLRYDYPPQVDSFFNSIAISDVVNTAAVLICPFFSSSAGRTYETWLVGPWSGCIRYRSFTHFIRNHLEAFIKDESM